MKVIFNSFCIKWWIRSYIFKGEYRWGYYFI